MGYQLGTVQHRTGIVALEQRGDGVEFTVNWSEDSPSLADWQPSAVQKVYRIGQHWRIDLP